MPSLSAYLEEDAIMIFTQTQSENNWCRRCIKLFAHYILNLVNILNPCES